MYNVIINYQNTTMSVKVAIRVRPFNQRQISLGSKCCVQMIDKKTKLTSNQAQKQYAKRQFTFDYSLWSHDGFELLPNGLMVAIDDRYWDQTRVFNQIGTQIINNAWMGYNCCLFAYGQTGSGKSYSMIGYGLNKGIVPLSCEQIFLRIAQNNQNNKTYSVTVSMIQIYNQKVQDLLISANKRPKGGLQIRQNKALGVYVEGITKHRVNSFRQIEKCMDQGSKNRSLASTQMNQYSSRAHTIISIEFIQRQQLNKNQITQKSSTIHLIDLAGSERVGKTGLTNTDRLKQAGNINKSLHHLGLVIQILAQKSQGKRKNEVVPYRSSALTRILQNSLGGNSKTIMICAISPSNDNYQQSLSTLKYADQVKKIKNNATVNQSLTDKVIRQLKQENSRLKRLIQQYNDRTTISPNQINQLQQAKIQQKLIQRNLYRTSFAVKQFGISSQENLLNNISGYDEQDQLNQSTDQSFMDLQIFKLDQPYITNLNEDQMLTGRVKYSIDPQIIIGRKQSIPTPQVILGALGIEKLHAKIYKKQDKIYICNFSQSSGDRTFVNGQNVYQQTQIMHNDRIIFGTSCVFILKTPSMIMRKHIQQSEINYEFAISQLESLQKNKSMTQDEDLALKLKNMQQQIENQKKLMQTKMKQQRQIYEQQIKLIKKEKQNQMKNIMNKLKKKQEDQKRILMQNKQMQLIKKKTQQLQQQLQRQRKKKEQLQQKLIQSALLEIEFQKQKRKQKQRIQQQKKLKAQMQRIIQQKQKIEQNQRKIRQEKQQQQKKKLQYQKKMKQVQQQEQLQKQRERIEQILQKKMQVCQNLNIIQQRHIQLKKSKKDAEQLRMHLIKKQKTQLQNKLVELLPIISQMNLISKQMNRQVQFQTKIDYQYFGIHQINQCLKNTTYKSRIKLKIQVNNQQEGRIYYWNIDRFKNRFDLAKDMLQKYIQNPRNPIFFDKDLDPFWDPPEPQLIGQSYLMLQHLMYNLDYTNQNLKIISDMTLKGEISVKIYPTSQDGSQNISKQQEKLDSIMMPRSLLQKDLHFIIKIDKLKLNQNVVQAYIQYEILNNYSYQKFQTHKIPKKQLGKQIRYQYHHTLKQVSQSTLHYLSKSQICFRVYATRRSNQSKKTSNTFAFSPMSANQPQNDMNQYFVQDFDFDDKTSLKSQVINHRNNGFTKSFKQFPSTGQIYQNKEVTNKIQISNPNLHKENEAKQKDKINSNKIKSTNSMKNSTTIQSRDSKNNVKINGDKKDEKCIIF